MGSRLNETCALTWDDVDTTLETIRFTVTKTDEVRIIPIPPGLVRIINEWRIESGDSPYLFPVTQKSKRPYIYDLVRKRFHKVCQNLELKDVVVHSLRHTAASWATQQNVNRRVVAELLGHSNVSTTDRYSHVSVEHLRSVVNVVEQTIGNTLNLKTIER